MPKYYGSGLIGLDVKPRRKNVRMHRNRFNSHYSKWFLPVILMLVTYRVHRNYWNQLRRDAVGRVKEHGREYRPHFLFQKNDHIAVRKHFLGVTFEVTF